jgi:hypothetical protein
VGAALACSPACGAQESPESAPTSAPATGSATGTAQRIEEALAKIVATCAEAIGSVETRRQGEPRWSAIGVGGTFRERDWARTGEHAFARLRFVGGGFLDMREKTTILVDTAIHVDTGMLVAVAEPGGRAFAVKAADGSEARIEASTGQQTELRLTPSADHGLEIAVTSGTAKLITQDGERTVAAGEASALANQRAGDVVKLLAFPRSSLPGIDARFKFVAGKPVDLKWQGVAKAARYHVQVARDTEFHEVVVDRDSTATKTTFAPDEVGLYVWRTAAIDSANRLGEYGFARRMYFEDETPKELLVAPTDGAKIGFSEVAPRITFSWQSASETPKYRLVIGTGADPKSKSVVNVVTGDQQVTRSLGEGDYHWGVYAMRGNRETPIFLSPRTLTVGRHRVKAKTDELWKDSGR